MINLRYHIVSITAVFLALGIGITMGSTFLGRETLDRINSNVKNVSSESKRVKAENAELRRQVDLAEERGTDLTDEGVRRMFVDQLEDVPVLIVAAPGVDRTSLQAATEAVRSSAALYLGTITVDTKVRLEGGAVADMADALDSTLRDVKQLQALAASRLALEMRNASRDGDGDVGAEAPQPTLPPDESSVVGALVDADFLAYDAGDVEVDPAALFTGHGYRYLVVTGPTPDVRDGAFLLPLVQQLAKDRAAQAVVAAAATGDESEETRATTLAPYLDDDVLADRISTVDDLESFSGVAAVVLSLEDLGVNRRGHYGYGEGRTQLPVDSG